MPARFKAGGTSVPSTGTKQIEKARINFFGTAVGALRGEYQGTFAIRTTEQEHVNKGLCYVYQANLQRLSGPLTPH